jgi:hypothetical protein
VITVISELIDFDLALKFGKVQPDAAVGLLFYFESLRSTIAQMVRHTLALGSMQHFQGPFDLFRRLLEHFHPNFDGSMLNARGDAHAALQKLWDFDRAHDRHVEHTMPAIVSYLIDLTRSGQCSPEFAHRVLYAIIRTGLQPSLVFHWAQTASDDREFDRLWKYDEPTRGVMSEEPAARPRLVCLLVGLLAQIGKSTPIDLGMSAFSHSQAKSLILELQSVDAVFEWALPSHSTIDIENLASAIAESARKYETWLRSEIANAPLSPEHIQKFRDEVAEYYGCGSPFRELIVVNHRVVTDPGIAETRFAADTLVDREMFINQDRITYLNGGSAAIADLAAEETQLAIAQLQSGGMEVQSQLPLGVPDCCAQAIAYLEKLGYRPDLLLVGANLFAQIDFYDCDGFINALAGGSTVSGAIGAYFGAAVVRCDALPRWSFLAIDTNAAMTLTEATSEPILEVRELEEPDILKLIDKGRTRDELRLKAVLHIEKTLSFSVTQPQAAFMAMCRNEHQSHHPA